MMAGFVLQTSATIIRPGVLESQTTLKAPT